MSREIKFRIWDNELGGYAPVECILGFICSKSEGILTLKGEDKKRFIIEQYTGVNSNNGVEIYEGDIVYSKQWQPNKMEVVFNRGGFCLKEGDESYYYPDIKYAEDMEIVGHIHEK